MAVEYLTIARVHMLRDETSGDDGPDGPRDERPGGHRRAHRLRSAVGRGLMRIGARLAGDDVVGPSGLGPALALNDRGLPPR